MNWTRWSVTASQSSSDLLYILTLVVHKAPAEFLKGSPVAHCPERAMELVVGYHQVFRVSSHVDYLGENHNSAHHSPIQAGDEGSHTYPYMKSRNLL